MNIKQLNGGNKSHKKNRIKDFVTIILRIEV